MIREWLGYDTVELISPHAEQVCLQRLRDSIGSEWKPFQQRQVLGAVGDHSFRLMVRHGPFTQNMFQTLVYGTTRAQGSTTKIVCRFGLQRLAAVICGLLFTVGLLAVGYETVLDLLKTSSLADVIVSIAIPTGYLLFVAVVVFVGRVIAQDEPFILLNFLRDTINAKEA